MKYRELGTSGIETSVIGLGTMSWPGCHFGQAGHADNPADYAVARDMVSAALESGITLFDSAEGYGRGLSEIWLGRALAELKAREKAIIVTKTGPLFDAEKIDGRACNLTKPQVLERCEKSLMRLGVDYIDLYLAHWVDPLTPVEETMEAANLLKQQGKIRAFGVSNFPPELLGAALKCGPVAANQLPYSLADRGIDADKRPFCLEHHVSVMAHSPLGKGILGGRYDAANLPPPDDYRHQRPHFDPRNLPHNVVIAQRLRELAPVLGTKPSRIALAWVLAQPGVTIALPGAKSPDQVRDNAAAGSLELPESVISELNSL